MNRYLLITGGTGMLGREIVTWTLKETDLPVVLLIHEKGIADESIKNNNRVKIIRGDVTEKDLGMTAADCRWLMQNVTHIIHAAASTRFDLPLPEARRVNVDGLKNMIALAENCRKLKQFGFLSTVYTSGKRTGLIYEGELEHTAGFVNTYEHSKYEAELVLAGVARKIPVATYRLSTVIGNSQTGEVTHFTAPHHALRMIYLGLAPMLPGTPEYLVDLISTDYTIQTIGQLFFHSFAPGQVFHITSGRKSYTLQEIIDATYQYFAEADTDWARRRYPKPEIVDQETFDLFMSSAALARNPVFQNVFSALGSFAHQLNYPKHFDNRNLTAALPEYTEKMPDIRKYYNRIIDDCVKTNWGRHA